MMIYQSGLVRWNALLPSLLSRHLHYLGVPNIPCVLSGHFYDSRVQRIGCGRHKGRAPRDKGLQEEFQTDGQTNKAGASRWQERDANRVFLQDHCALVRAARQNKRRQCCQTNVFVNLYKHTFCISDKFNWQFGQICKHDFSARSLLPSVQGWPVRQKVSVQPNTGRQKNTGCQKMWWQAPASCRLLTFWNIILA